MKNKLWLCMAIVMSLAVAMLGGCGSNNDPTLNSEPVLGEIAAGTGNTSFLQSVAAQDDDDEEFPGQANVWDMYTDFSLDDGGDDQFDNAMVLLVDGTYFAEQTYADLTFYTPGAEVADGVKVAVVADEIDGRSALDGTYSVGLNNIHDGRLSQQVDLTAATAPISLDWSWIVDINGGDFSMPAELNVVVRDPADGSLLDTLYTETGYSNDALTADLSAYIGLSVIISFEISSNGNSANQIDDISVTDGGATEYISNGDFETGDLTGWSTNEPVELQNMTSAPETLSGLDVTRSFYTVPDKLWGRWVDVFENQTAAAITVDVDYETDLGSDDSGILYLTPETGSQALTCWDGSASDRDVALVFGTADSVDFLSDDGIANDNGSEYITHSFSITVDPGESLAIVNFIIMNGVDTGETAADITALATAIDAEAKVIVNNFWKDGQYRTGMTQAQIDAIVNF